MIRDFIIFAAGMLLGGGGVLFCLCAIIIDAFPPEPTGG